VETDSLPARYDSDGDQSAIDDWMVRQDAQRRERNLVICRLAVCSIRILFAAVHGKITRASVPGLGGTRNSGVPRSLKSNDRIAI
jgi:hypothetical protein